MVLHLQPLTRARNRVLIIFNPTAGAGGRRRLAQVLEALRAAGATVSVQETLRAGDATAFAGAAPAAGFQVVVAAGGDGTANEVASGLVGSALPMALLPLGTANVLAAEIGLARDAATIAAAILRGPVRPVHLGLANGRHFLVMAGVGFDAHVVAEMDLRWKRALGKLAYVLQSLLLLWRYRFPAFEVQIDGVSHRAYSVVVAKAHYYGGRHVCAPEARLQDARFQVCLFLDRGPLAVLRYGLRLLTGSLPRAPGIELVFGSEIAVSGPPGDPVQGDGDSIGQLPLRIALEPRLLLLVGPAGPAALADAAAPC